MTDKPNYYAMLPAEVRYDKNLKDKAKLLYAEITALCNKDGYCYAKNRYFADLYGVSITTISILIKNLIENGYIFSEIIYKKGTKEIENRYLKIFKGPYLKKLNNPIKENLKDNNINNNIINSNIIYIVDLLNSKLGTNYKSTTPKTKSLISARLNEGFTIEEFKKVIENKYNEWYGTDMEKYLRPETLFGTKFESYLNQKVKTEVDPYADFIRLD